MNIVAESLIPQQQSKSALRLLRSADCYLQRFIKFPGTGIFHSYAELIHSAILESRPSVLSFVPQALALRVGNRRYVPDLYILEDGKRIVVEIKPGGKFKDELKIPLVEFFNFNNMTFKVLSNEEILAKETLGLNWLHITRSLVNAESEDTQYQERTILTRIFESGELNLGDILDLGDRLRSYLDEIAVFRLAHRGKINLDLEQTGISFDTRVTLCT